MKSGGVLRHFLLAFAIALIVYVAAFWYIEHRRIRQGPWHLTFRTDSTGSPTLLVEQSKLGISNVVFTLAGEIHPRSNLTRMVVFDRPLTNVPYGRVLFFDTTFLPGTVTLELFGHEIEMLPRTLVVNSREIPWASNTNIVLEPSAKIPAEQRDPRQRLKKRPPR